MNRLVIIGNGFDLAHGLPTSYSHFIDDFWAKIVTHYQTDNYKKLITLSDLHTGFFNYGSNKIVDFSSFLNNLKKYCENYKYRVNNESFKFYSVDHLDDNKLIFEFKSQFFKQICIKRLEKWVDIETEYYRTLVALANPNSILKENIPEKLKKLNSDFELIKKLLFQYLKVEICQKYDFKIDDSNPIFQYFINEIDELDQNSEQSYSTLFLSFNYTPTARLYNDFLKNKLYRTNINYIHGEIENDENDEIVFGYGDDKDENYKLIKSFNNNDFLENIKPFEYKNNDNFENLLEFINQSKYVVYLFGHSCGLSDKYLLNQIFEHENCSSIKVLYRLFDDGKDDFRNKTRDISRHFDDDRLSILRIVNKKKSTNIPQDIRFKEKKII